MSKVSGHASRVWITRARSCWCARAIWAANTSACMVAGRVVVVEVEPALPHRHDLGLAEERLDPAEAVLGVVRVHAGGGEHPPGVPAGDVDVVGRLADVAADRDQPLHAGLGGRGHLLVGAAPDPGAGGSDRRSSASREP